MKVGLLIPARMSPEDIAFAESLRTSPVGLAGIFGVRDVRPISGIRRLRRTLRREAGAAIRRLRGAPRPPTRSAGEYAREAGIPLEIVPTANAGETVAALHRHGIDQVVARGVGILRPVLLDAPGVVFVNAHAGRLPRYGGMNVVEWAVFHGDPIYGTVHRIDSGIDTGDLLVERPLVLGRPATVPALRAAAFEAVWEMVAPALADLSAGLRTFRPQPRDASRTQWFRMHPVLLERVSLALREGSFFERQERELEQFRDSE